LYFMMGPLKKTDPWAGPALIKLHEYN